MVIAVRGGNSNHIVWFVPHRKRKEDSPDSGERHKGDVHEKCGKQTEQARVLLAVVQTQSNNRPA
jgi:hypothetical protein